MRMLAQNDPCYMENISFVKYLTSLADNGYPTVYDLGYHGKTLAIEDEGNNALMLNLQFECDSGIGIVSDILTVVNMDKARAMCI